VNLMWLVLHSELQFSQLLKYVASGRSSSLRKIAVEMGQRWLQKMSSSRVARWFIFKPKIPNLDQFWRIWQWNILVYFIVVWYIFRPFGIFSGTLVYFVVIWYVFTVLIYCNTKNLAILSSSFRGIFAKKAILV
jgi:hypothetical protein